MVFALLPELRGHLPSTLKRVYAPVRILRLGNVLDVRETYHVDALGARRSDTSALTRWRVDFLLATTRCVAVICDISEDTGPLTSRSPWRDGGSPWVMSSLAVYFLSRADRTSPSGRGSSRQDAAHDTVCARFHPIGVRAQIVHILFQELFLQEHALKLRSTCPGFPPVTEYVNDRSISACPCLPLRVAESLRTLHVYLPAYSHGRSFSASRIRRREEVRRCVATTAPA